MHYRSWENEVGVNELGIEKKNGGTFWGRPGSRRGCRDVHECNHPVRPFPVSLGLRSRSEVLWLLGSRVRIPLRVWMFVLSVCCVCDELITCSEESYCIYLSVCLSVCAIYKPQQRGGVGPNWAAAAQKTNKRDPAIRCGFGAKLCSWQNAVK
jgi:hypothetical protein